MHILKEYMLVFDDMGLYIRFFDFPKLYSSMVFVFIVQARYWLALFRDIG